MKFAVLIRGPAGSGKTTTAALLQEKLDNTANVDVDKLKHMMSMESSPKRTGIAHEVGLFFLEKLSNNGYNIIVEEIFRPDFYEKVEAFFDEKGYEMVKVFLKTSKKKLVARDRERKEKTKGREIITKLADKVTPLDEDLEIDTTNKKAEEVVNIILEAIP